MDLVVYRVVGREVLGLYQCKKRVSQAEIVQGRDICSILAGDTCICTVHNSRNSAHSQDKVFVAEYNFRLLIVFALS
jgi:hypothetical protein